MNSVAKMKNTLAKGNTIMLFFRTDALKMAASSVLFPELICGNRMEFTEFTKIPMSGSSMAPKENTAKSSGLKNPEIISLSS